jgi:hypothetical protein
MGRALREEQERNRLLLTEGYKVFEEYAKQGQTAKDEGKVSITTCRQSGMSTPDWEVFQAKSPNQEALHDTSLGNVVDDIVYCQITRDGATLHDSHDVICLLVNYPVLAKLKVCVPPIGAKVCVPPIGAKVCAAYRCQSLCAAYRCQCLCAAYRCQSLCAALQCLVSAGTCTSLPSSKPRLMSN